jgi:GGDEF domain-containing protein
MNLLHGFTTPAALRDRNAAIEEALRTACHVVGAEAASLTLLGKHDPVRHRFSRGGKLISQAVPRPTSGLVRSTLQEGRLVAISEPELDPRYTQDDGPEGMVVRNVIAVPVHLRMQNMGTLACFNLPDKTFESTQTANSIYLLATCIGLALENARLARTVRRVAVTDDLTQVYNYRFLRAALRREMKRANRFRQAFVLLMVDVDHLKEYNDREGHLRGSYLLRDLARILSREGGISVAERIRAAVQAHSFYRCEQGEMTVSVGLAMFPEDGIQPTALIAASDAALYAAKQRGRNQVAEATGLILRDEMSA